MKHKRRHMGESGEENPQMLISLSITFVTLRIIKLYSSSTSEPPLPSTAWGKNVFVLGFSSYFLFVGRGRQVD